MPFSRPEKALSQREFIAMLAMLFACVAFSIDGMLPALPRIAAELTPADVNRAQLIVTTFLFGLGFGTLLSGPISDRLGRKRTIVGGVAIFMLGAFLASNASSLEMLLGARLLQGIGAAGPRIVTLAMVRDLYSGRQMARLVSFVMMIFTLVPAVAPSIGTFIMAGFGWRGIFDVLMIFACLAALWLGLRQPETLAPERRRPLRLRPIAAAFVEVLSHRTVLTVTLAQTMIFGAFFALLSSTQPIFDKAFGEAQSFPYWFAAMALSAGLANLVNASLVVRLGMRRLVTTVIGLEVILAGLVTLATASGALPLWLGFPAYLLWNAGMLWTATFSLGNLNAMALEPLGHIAGMAAAVNGAVATMAGVLIAIPIGLAFDGTPLPLMLADLGLIVAALVLMLSLPRGID